VSSGFQTILVELAAPLQEQSALEKASELWRSFPEADFLFFHSPKGKEVVAGLPGTDAFQSLEQRNREEAERHARELRDRFPKEAKVQLLVEKILDPRDLLELAQERNADLLVLNALPRGGFFSRWVQGDRAAWMLRHGEIPVLVARADGRKEPTFAGVLPEEPTEFKAAGQTPADLDSAFPPYRSREHEVSVFLEVLEKAGPHTAVLEPMGSALAEALASTDLKVTPFCHDSLPADLEPQNSFLLTFSGMAAVRQLEDQQALLKFCGEKLSREGVLIADLFNPWLRFPVDTVVLSRDADGEEQVELPDGTQVRRNIRVLKRDYLNQFQTVEKLYWVDHDEEEVETRREVLESRFYSRFEFQHLLTSHNFHLEAIWGSRYPGEMVFLARKGTR